MALGPFGAVGGIAVGTAVGNVAGAIIAPSVQAVINEAFQRYQTTPIQAIEAAQLVAAGERDRDWGASEAQNSGINGDRFDALVDLIDTAPGIGELLVLLRRGTINQAQFNAGVKRQNIEDQWLGPILTLTNTFLSPAEAAAARQYGYISQAQQYAYAAREGLSNADAELQFMSTGNPPGPSDALTMLRRNIITRAEFDVMIAEGNTKVKYTDEFAALMFQPMSVASAVEGVIKERMTPAEGHAIAQAWGIDPATFDQIVENAGRPIGAQQAVTLYNRKFYTKADVQEAVARSNIRTEYTDAIIELGKHYPTLFQMRQLVTSGSLPVATAKTWLNNNGYHDDVAVPLLDAWSQGKTSAEKDLAKSEILALYEGRIITQAQATTMLTKFGYDAQEVTFLLSLADSRRSRRFLDSALTRIHNLFVTRQIDAATASRDMSALDLQTGAIDDLMAIWNDERAAQVLSLTPAQVLRALRLDIVTTNYAYNWLVNRGYSDNDARLQVSIVKGLGAANTGRLQAALG